MKTTLSICAAALSMALSSPNVLAREITAPTQQVQQVTSSLKKSSQRKFKDSFVKAMNEAIAIIHELNKNFDEIYISLLNDDSLNSLSDESIESLKSIEKLLAFQVSDSKLVLKKLTSINDSQLESIYNIQLRNLQKAKVKCVRINDFIRQFTPPTEVFNSDIDFDGLKEIAEITNKALGDMKLH